MTVEMSATYAGSYLRAPVYVALLWTSGEGHSILIPRPVWHQNHKPSHTGRQQPQTQSYPTDTEVISVPLAVCGVILGDTNTGLGNLLLFVSHYS